MESHKLPDNPFEDPFQTSDVEVAEHALRENWRRLSYALWALPVLLIILLVGLILTAPARGLPSATPTPRPILPVICAPPSCTVSTVEPTPTATPEPTETPVVVTVAPKPDWLSVGCLITMQKIIQYELNGSTDPDAYRFLATQLIWRAHNNHACDFDGQWTGYAKTSSIQPIVGAALNSVMSDYPAMNWPYCQYVVSFAGLDTLKRKGLMKRDLPILPFVADPYGNIFGVNCTPG